MTATNLLLVLSVSVVLLSITQVWGIRNPGRDGDLPGWDGEKERDVHAPAIPEPSVVAWKPQQVWVETVSMEPRAFIFHNFLTAAEADYLVALAKPHMEKSQVVDTATGKHISGGNIRTSSGHFLYRGQDNVVTMIEQRIADFTNVPADHGEPIHVLNYRQTEKYEAHYDYFHDTVNTVNGGQRIATMLMYLSDVEEGGETVFPMSVEKPVGPTGSECARQGIHVKPKKGDALLFWSIKPDMVTPDLTSLHGGCPVIRGDKWSATKWMRQNHYVAPQLV